VEYGGEGGEGYKIESYWAQDLSEEEWKAIFAEASGRMPSDDAVRSGG
jgi:hypothetical protein